MAKIDDYMNETIFMLNQIPIEKRKLFIRAIINKILKESNLSFANRFDIMNVIIDDITKSELSKGRVANAKGILGTDGRVDAERGKPEESSEVQTVTPEESQGDSTKGSKEAIHKEEI